jgi:uncharacterized protein YqeY
MSLLSQIKSDQLQARKSRESLKASLLTTLIGEAEMVGKNQGREVSDQEVQATIKKFLKGINETIEFCKSVQNEAGLITVEAEKAILSVYVPTQLTPELLQAHITEIHAGLLSSGEKADMGSIMKTLKMLYEGEYDAKLASALIKEELQ